MIEKKNKSKKNDYILITFTGENWNILFIEIFNYYKITYDFQ